jgi:hypothetical protein
VNKITHILNERILHALIKEENETAKRYSALAVQYNIPELHEAAIQEANHARLFESLLRRNW